MSQILQEKTKSDYKNKIRERHQHLCEDKKGKKLTIFLQMI